MFGVEADSRRSAQQPLSNRRQRVLELAVIVAVIWEMEQGVGITQNRLDPLPQFVNVTTPCVLFLDAEI